MDENALTDLRLTYLRIQAVHAAGDLREGRTQRAFEALLAAIDITATEKKGAELGAAIKVMEEFLDNIVDSKFQAS